MSANNSNTTEYIPPSNNQYYKSWGGWPKFMHSYGLKPWDLDDVEEGKRIIEEMKKLDKLEWEEEQAKVQSQKQRSGENRKE